MKQQSSYIRFSNALFVIYIVSLIGCGYFFYTRTLVLDEAFDMVSNSIRIKQKIKQLEAEVSITESAQRGFLITGDSIFLEHFQVAGSLAFDAIDTIKSLAKDNQEQIENADQMQYLITKRISLLKQTLESTDFRYADSEAKLERLLNGKVIMDSLLNLGDSMTSAENNILEERKKFRDEARELTPKYVFGILLFSVVIISVLYFLALKRRT